MKTIIWFGLIAVGFAGTAVASETRYVGVALDQLIAQYNLKAVAIRCWDELEKRNGYRHHVAFVRGNWSAAIVEAFGNYLGWEIDRI